MNKPKSVAEEHPILDLTKQHLDIEADETAHSEALEMAIYFKRLEMPDIANMYQLKANHLKEDLIFKRGVLAGAELIMDLIMELEFAPEKKVGDLLDDENYLRNMIDKDPSKNPLT